MIKIFTIESTGGVSYPSTKAGEMFEKQISEWILSGLTEHTRIEIISAIPTSNKYGWLIVVHYRNV